MRTLLIACAIIQFWITLRLRAVSRNKTCMYANGTILYPVNKVHVRSELFQKANGYKPWLVNITVDVCRFLKKPFNPFAILVSKLFLEFTNFNGTCPLIGPQIIDGFYLRWKTLPHALPTGEYLLGLTWFFDRRPQFITNVYFIFTEDLMAYH